MSLRKSCSASVVISGSGSTSGSGSSTVRVDDRDLRLLERGVEVVELRRLELELVERERELVGVELAGAIPALEQPLALVAREDLLDRRSSGSALRFFSGQTAPLPRRPSHGSYRCGGRQKRRVTSAPCGSSRGSDPPRARAAIPAAPSRRGGTGAPRPRCGPSRGAGRRDGSARSARSGTCRESGPSRPKALSGASLSNCPTAPATCASTSFGIAPRRPVEDPRGRRPAARRAGGRRRRGAARERHPGSPRRRSASSWRAGGRLVIAGDAPNDGMNAGRPRGRSGCRRFPATTAYGVSGSASSDGAPRRDRIALVRPQPREPEVELHDRDLRVELRELLEPVERAVGPRGERARRPSPRASRASRRAPPRRRCHRVA